MNRFWRNLIWSLIFILALYFGSVIQYELRVYQNMYYKVFPYLLFTVLFPILAGMLLRLPKLVTDIKSKKRWSVNWSSLGGFGIPLLLIAISPLVFFMKAPLIIQTFWSITLGSSFTVTTIAGVVFGYILLDSLKEK